MTDVLSADTRRNLDALVRAEQRSGRAPSLVLAAGRDGGRTYLGTAGEPVGPDTQFRIGSITKTFTAALVLQLRDAGRLDLDDRLGEHLPEIATPQPSLRQLLSHTAGLQTEPDGPWWERHPGGTVAELIASVGTHKLGLPTGRFRHYSNLGFGLLGAVVERRGGAPWAERLRSHLLEPAGLADTTYAPREPYARGHLVHPWQDLTRVEPTPDTGAMAPAGQLWSTVDDLMQWSAVLTGRRPEVLAPQTAEQMRTVVAMDDATWTLGTGLGVQMNRHGERVYCGHSGSMPGFLACVATDPTSGWATVAFANCYTGVSVTSLAHRALTRILDAAPDSTIPWTPGAAAPPAVEPLTGSWWWMGQQTTVGFDGRLVLDADGARSAFEPVGTDAWRCVEGEERGELLSVERDEAGRPVALVLAGYVHVRDPWPANPR